MNDLDQLLHDFKDAAADRCWIVSQLEEVADERVVTLFVTALEDPGEDEEVRIEILKSLVMRNDSAEHHARLAQAVLNVLQIDEDELIRQYAANALSWYPSIDGGLECLETLVRNESEDLDVRHNALSAIEGNRSLPKYREALERLVEVPEFGRSAQRALDEE